MEEERSCSTRWPRFAVYIYSTISVLAGGVLIGIGVYILKQQFELKRLLTNELKDSISTEFDPLMFLYLSAIIVGSCLVLSSVSLAVCGAYKMNKSCVAAHTTVLVLGFFVAVAVGLTLVTHEQKFTSDINRMSSKPADDVKVLVAYLKVIMIVTLSLSAYLMLGVVFNCCLQKAIEDVNKNR